MLRGSMFVAFGLAASAFAAEPMTSSSSVAAEQLLRLMSQGPTPSFWPNQPVWWVSPRNGEPLKGLFRHEVQLNGRPEALVDEEREGGTTPAVVPLSVLRPRGTADDFGRYLRALWEWSKARYERGCTPGERLGIR